MVCQQMELGEPDDSGRRRPVPIEGETFTLDCDTIVAAISQEPDFDGFENLREGRDWAQVDDRFESTKEGETFAGGDVVDLGLVTIALAQGRVAAETIHARLRGLDPETVVRPPVIPKEKMQLGFYEKTERAKTTELPPEERFEDPDVEIKSGLTEEQVIEEAARCLSCGMCFNCGTCWSFCQDQAIVKPLRDGEPYKFKLEFCKGCDKCAEQCPCGYIEMYDPTVSAS
jgi:Pyruvate/2-oxoacid:ferredoxin oxidoreductase delta subunit